MKARDILLIGAAALCCALASCGGSDHGGSPMQTNPPPPPPPSSTKNLDTAAVLAIVQTQTSDTADPFEVDNAAVAITPANDETSPPLNVNPT
jgi:hypothetical protein